MNNTGIIILAAGSSTRMGEPKQLMVFHHQTFLQHIIGEAKRANLHPVICVTGFQSVAVSEHISALDVKVLYNEKWPRGMGSSISVGIKEVLNSDVDAVILAVSDQPYVSSALLETMLNAGKQSGKGIVASSYAGILGTPVLFSQKYFNLLLQLDGNEGAKKIVREYEQDVCPVEFEKGNVDIDTKKDYENLIAEKI